MSTTDRQRPDDKRPDGDGEVPASGLAPTNGPVVRWVQADDGVALRVVDRPRAAGPAGPGLGAEMAFRSGRSGPDGGDATPIILVHGIAGTAADWDEVAPDLARARRVLAYDQRGHGKSGRAPAGRDGYTFDRLVADLAAVAGTLAPEGLHLVGHSMGGLAALRYTLERPLGVTAPVRSLVLVDMAAEPASGLIGRKIVPWLLELAATAGAHGGRGHEDRPPEPGQPAEPTNPTDRALTGFREVDPDALAAFGHELGDYPSLLARLPEIAVPTTVVVGEHDGWLRQAARALAAGIPGAHLAMIADAGHNPHASHPLAWLSAVEHHFGNYDRRRGDSSGHAAGLPTASPGAGTPGSVNA